MDTTSTTTFGYLLMGAGPDPWSMIFLGIVSGLVGMFSHWAKIVFRDKVDVTVLEYFFFDNLKASIYASAGTLAALFAAFAPLDYTTMSLYQVVTQAFAIGYASDSIINKTAARS